MRSFLALLALLCLTACGSSVDSSTSSRVDDVVDDVVAELPSAPTEIAAPVIGCWFAPGEPMPDGATCITEAEPRHWGRCETLQGVDTSEIHLCAAYVDPCVDELGTWVLEAGTPCLTSAGHDGECSKVQVDGEGVYGCFTASGKP